MSGAVPLLKHTPSAQDPQVLETITVQREPLIAKLVEDARDTGGGMRHRLLIGPRGMGKTHILSLVASRLKAAEGPPSLRMAWLEEDPWAFGAYEKFLAAILACVAREASDPELARRAKELRAGGDGAAGEAEQALRDTVGDGRLVLIVENLDEIFRRIGVSGQERLRALAEDWTQMLILASAPQLFEGVRLHESPFYGFFAVTHLDELSLDSAAELMRLVAELRGDGELAGFLGSEVARRRMAAIEALAGGHPRIWLLLSGCVSIKAIDELVPLFLEALDDLTPYYQDRLRELGDQQQELVVLLSEAGGALSNRDLAERSGIAQNQVATILKQLDERGYVRRAELPEELATGDARMSFWELREPLMRLCLDVKQVRGGPLRLLVEFLRAWYGPRLLDELATLPASAKLAASYASEAFRTLEALPAEYLFSGTSGEIVARAELGLSITPDRPALKFARIGGLMMENRHEEAREALEPLIAEEEDDAVRLTLTMQLCEAKEALGESIEVEVIAEEMAELARERPDDAYAQSVAASGLVSLGRNEEALAVLPRALELNPDDGTLHGQHGRALGEAGRYEEALAAFDEAVALEPENPAIQTNRGIDLRMLGRLDDAVAAFEQALALEPDNPRHHRSLGDALQRLDRDEEALAAFEKAVELDPDHGVGQFQLGVLLAIHDRPEEALAAFERTGALDADKEEVKLFCQSLSLQQLGRLEQAERAARDVISLAGSENAVYFFALAEILVEGDDVAEGLAKLREGLALWGRQQGEYTGDPELVIRILWMASRERDARRGAIDEVVATHGALGAGEDLGRELVNSVALIADPETSFEEADEWVEDWLAAPVSEELEIPLEMLRAARDWKRDKDRSHLLRLPAEQRGIITDLLRQQRL